MTGGGSVKRNGTYGRAVASLAAAGISVADCSGIEPNPRLSSVVRGAQLARDGKCEMVTFAILLAMGGCEPQLKGHIRGNAAAGNGRGTLLDVITQCLPYVGYPRALNALRCLDEVLPAAAAPAPAVSGGFSRGEVLTSRNFSGAAWLKMLVDNKACDIAVYNVTFAKGCRNSWHRHAVGQLLLCTAGIGHYQERGREARRLLPGDVVEIPADAEHWHGAAPDCEFAHIGITPKMSENGVVWLDPVTDAEYAAATTPSRH